MKNWWQARSFWQKFFLGYGALFIFLYLFLILYGMPYSYEGGTTFHCGDFGGKDCSLGQYLMVPIYLLALLFISAPIEILIRPDIITEFRYFSDLVVFLPVFIIVSVPILIHVHYSKSKEKTKLFWKLMGIFTLIFIAYLLLGPTIIAK